MAWIVHISNQAGSMTEAEMQNNAREVYGQLISTGRWTLNSISGVLGNWEYESYLNPGQWQIGYPIGGNSGGVGLGQWTPPSHLRDWMELEGHDLYSGYWQVYYLDYNNIYYNGSYHGSQWNTGPSPSWTWDYFRSSTNTPEECANAFFQQWEQPGDVTAPIRMELARKWYEYLGGVTPGGGKLPNWLLYHMTRGNNNATYNIYKGGYKK